MLFRLPQRMNRATATTSPTTMSTVTSIQKFHQNRDPSSMSATLQPQPDACVSASLHLHVVRKSGSPQIAVHLNARAVPEVEPLLDVKQASEEVGVGITLDETTTAIERGVPGNVRVRSQRDAFASASPRLALDCFHERAPMAATHHRRPDRELLEMIAARDPENVGEPERRRPWLVARHQDEARLT